jgi:sarcosine oxidase subunit gamma
MAERTDGQSGSDRLAGSGSSPAAPVGQSIVEEGPWRVQVGLRLAAGDARARAAAELVIGPPLPLRPSTVTAGNGRWVLWLGPDEWLVVGADGDSIEAPLRAALAGSTASVVDVSAARTCFEVAGSNAREVLASGCSIDLHPRVFGPGRCVQTLLARVPVILHQLDDDPRFRIMVRPSFAEWLAAWFEDAGGTAGVARQAGLRDMLTPSPGASSQGPRDA